MHELMISRAIALKSELIPYSAYFGVDEVRVGFSTHKHSSNGAHDP